MQLLAPLKRSEQTERHLKGRCFNGFWRKTKKLMQSPAASKRLSVLLDNPGIVNCQPPVQLCRPPKC